MFKINYYSWGRKIGDKYFDSQDEAIEYAKKINLYFGYRCLVFAKVNNVWKEILHIYAISVC